MRVISPFEWINLAKSNEGAPLESSNVDKVRSFELVGEYEKWPSYELKCLPELFLRDVLVRADIAQGRVRRDWKLLILGIAVLVSLAQLFLVIVIYTQCNSLTRDPLVHLNQNSTGFDNSNSVHVAMTSVMPEAKHPDNIDGDFFQAFVCVAFMFLLSGLQLKDLMEVLLIVFHLGLEAHMWGASFDVWEDVVPCAGLVVYFLATLAMCVAQMAVAGKIVVASPDMDTVLGTCMGLYILSQVDDVFREVLNTVFPFAVIGETNFDSQSKTFKMTFLYSFDTMKSVVMSRTWYTWVMPCCAAVLWLTLSTIGLWAAFGGPVPARGM